VLEGRLWSRQVLWVRGRRTRNHQSSHGVLRRLYLGHGIAVGLSSDLLLSPRPGNRSSGRWLEPIHVSSASQTASALLSLYSLRPLRSVAFAASSLGWRHDAVQVVARRPRRPEMLCDTLRGCTLHHSLRNIRRTRLPQCFFGS
jgi:hypothetical protein